MNFEYKTVTCEWLDLEKELNRLGKEGWEAIALIENNAHCGVLLKRRIS
jgi:hypothetical protein